MWRRTCATTTAPRRPFTCSSATSRHGRADSRIITEFRSDTHSSEHQSQPDLKRARIRYAGDLIESGDRIGRIDAGSEVRIAGQGVQMVRQVEAFDHRFEL